MWLFEREMEYSVWSFYKHYGNIKITFNISEKKFPERSINNGFVLRFWEYY